MVHYTLDCLRKGCWYARAERTRNSAGMSLGGSRCLQSYSLKLALVNGTAPSGGLGTGDDESAITVHGRPWVFA